MTAKRTSTDRPLYSKRFLSTYGQRLRREEIRLVQGYRGLAPTQREGLLMLVSALVIDRVKGAA
jgi:hypothetical protein